MNSWKQKTLQEIKQQTEVFEKKAGQKNLGRTWPKWPVLQTREDKEV